jgi:putative transposase
MSRYRLEPTPQQAAVLLRHCSDARYVWNLCVEQQSWWRQGRESAPGYLEQARQLTAARAESPWLREGSQMVQQQALRDFAQAMRSFFAGTHRRPRWRKKGEDEGFRVVAISVVRRAAPEPQPRRGQGPEGRLGQVPLVP